MDRNAQLRAHILKSRWYKVFIAAAAIVVFITTYMLILPAITLDAKCGKEEHKHAEECYKENTTLTCQIEESAGHIHSDACYQTVDNLICGMEESEPVVQDVVNEETGEVETVVVSEGHIHDANCYAQETQLICGQEETEGHTHSERCYTKEKALNCGIEEHEHKDSCYHEQSDPNADLENEAIWTETFKDVQLTGKWNEDIVAIAKTQVGYKESSKNFIYDEEDEKDGYTRYGAWYGDPYGEWCAMFASFDIYYAQVGQDELGRSFPLEANCANWINKLSELGYYHRAQDSLYMDQLGRETYTENGYFVEPGDLIFFKLDEKSSKISDHVGIVTKVTDKKIYTIQGNSNYSVLEKDYNVGDVSIVGFGEIPENPNYVDPNKKEETEKPKEEAEIEENNSVADAAEESVATAEVIISEQPQKKSSRSLLKSLPGISLLAEGDANGSAHNFRNDITNVFVSVNNQSIPQENGVYQVKKDDTVKFDIQYTLKGNTLADTNTITYQVPTSGIAYQTGTVTGTINGKQEAAGTYEINSDGTITIVFNDDFVNQNKAGNAIDGTISFSQNASSFIGSDSNDGHMPFKDGLDFNFHITDRTITNYDLSLKKTQGTIQGNKQTYTIEVSTTKGTDNQQVSLSDTLDKMHISGNVTIKDKNGNTVATLSDKNGQSNFNYNLPAMNAGDKYTITYEAELNSDQTAEQVTGTNTAKAEFTDHDGNKYEPSQKIDTTFDRKPISKNGSQNGDKIDWTITLNDKHENIAGWILEDEMMKGQDITVTGGNSSDYTYDKTNGKLTFYDNGSSNTNTYTVTFSTPITEDQYGTNVKNTAIFKDKNGNPHPADKEVYTQKPAENNPLYKSGQKLADGRIEWTIVVDGRQENIANQVLRDDAFKDPTFQITSVVRNYYNGDYDPTQDYTLDKNAGTITFKATDNGENKNRYEIKYTVTPAYGWGQNTFTNVGQLGTHTPVTGTVDGGNNPPGSKEAKGYDTQNDTVILKWHASVGGNGELQAPWTFEDWLDSGDGYFTMDQLKAIEATIRSFGINNFTMIAYPDASHSNNGENVNASASSTTQFRKYKITFNDTLAAGTKLEWDYQSVGLSTDTTNTYNNHAKINNHWQYDASTPYEHKPVLKKTNMWGTTLKYDETDPNQNYINWMLEVNIPAGTTDTEWVITEHVPSGLTNIVIEPILNQENNSYPADTNFTITSSKNEAGDYIIKFNPSLYAGQTKFIKVAGLVRASEIPMNADKTTAVKVYQNSASITYKDGTTYEAPPVDKRVEREYSDNTLAKGAEFDEATGIITYHIDINPEKVVIPEDKSYSVVDEIKYNYGYCKLEIVPGSILVKETLTGRVLNASECLIIEGDSMDDGQGNYRQKIYFTIISDQLITIEYQYKYTDVNGKLWGHGVNNHVTLENDRGWHSETDNNITNTYEESQATATVNSKNVYKVDAADHTTFLPGATFDIYKWSGSEYVIETSNVQTGSDGSLINTNGITSKFPYGFIPNIAYKIVEKSAPTGYTVNSTPVEFYTKGAEYMYKKSVPENFAGTVLSPGGVIYFEDARVEGDRDTKISVKKNWVNHLGNDISNEVNTDIQFTLKQIEKKYRGSGSTGSDAIPGVVLKLQYSDGKYETVFMEDVCIGDSINAKVLYNWNIINEDTSIDQNWGTGSRPTYNGSYDDSKAYNGIDRNAYCLPLTVNSRVITVYTPDGSNNNVHIDYEKTSSGSGSGSSTAELIGTNEQTLGNGTITKSNGYVWSSSTLPAYKINGDGTTSTYSYYIVEQSVPGYITNYDRNDAVAGVGAGTITITNTRPNVNEDTELTVRKVWRDAENNLMIDKEIPESAVIEIWQVANGDKEHATKLEDKTVTLNRSNNWQTTVSQLPKVRRNGSDVVSYTYYFVEQTQTGYEISYSNGETALGQGTVIITNKKTDTPEDKDTSVTVEKVWKDKDGNTINAPDGQTIIMDLYQIIDNGAPTKLEDKSVTLPDNGSWSKTVANLPLTRIDKQNSAVEHQYKYYFVEREVPVGYEVSYSNDDKKPVDKGTVTVTNKKTTGITVNKQWLNADGADITGSMGDASVDIQLIQTTGYNTSNSTSPAKMMRAAGRSGGSCTVHYGKGHYDATALGTGNHQCEPGTVMTIVVNTTGDPIVRTWTNGNSFDYQYTELPDGEPVGSGLKTYTYQITISSDLNVGIATWDNDGTVSVSFSDESDTPGGGEEGGDTPGGEEGGDTPGGEEGGDSGDVTPTEEVYQTVTLNAANNWAYTFVNLPTTGTNAAGQNVTYRYYVKELSVPNYSTSYNNNGGITDGVITVINTSTRKPENTEITLVKEWKGPDGQPLGADALIGKTAKFKLMTFSGNNKDEATQYGEVFTLPENGSWTKTFTNLAKKTYDESGHAINWKYFFVEVAPEEGTEINYQKDTIFSFLPFVDGSENAEDEATSGGTVKVTNTIQPETTTISVEKKWKDAQGNDTTAPQSPDKVTVNLYKITDNQGEAVKVNEDAIELNAGNSWRYEEKDLVKKEYVDGVEHNYTYYFEEAEVKGYTTTYQAGTSEAVENAATIPVSEGTFRVMNTEVPKTSVTVNKKWFKDVNGTESDITAEKTGSIDFYLYRLEILPDDAGTDQPGTEEPDNPPITPPDHSQHTQDKGTIIKTATCTEEGSIVYKCTVCGAIIRTESISCLGHDWEDWIITKEPTTSEEGTKQRTCRRDSSHVEYATIPKHEGSSDISTINVRVINYGMEKCSETVAANSSIHVIGTFNGIYGPNAVTVNNNGQSVVGQLDEINSKIVYEFDYQVGDTDIDIDVNPNSDASFFTWKVLESSDINPQTIANSNARIAVRSFAKNASLPISNEVIIPDGYVLMNEVDSSGNIKPFTIYSDQNWIFTKIFDDAVPGATYKYIAVEKLSDNFNVEYSGQETNQIVINNTITERSYELPHTGGLGTKLITMLGILLMAVASSLMILKKHRKEEIW